MFTKGVIAVAAALSVTSVTTAGVYAQSPEPPEVRRPYRGLFGGPPDPNSPHSLSLTGSVFGAYDDNVTEALTNESGAPWLQDSGTYWGANVGLNYLFSLPGQRVDFSGRVGGQLQYFDSENRSDLLPGAQADVALTYRVTSSLSFNARQSAAYSSAYGSSLYPLPDESLGHDVSQPVDFDYALFEMRGVRSTTRVGLSQAIGQYASVSGSYQLRNHMVLDEEVVDDSQFHDYTTQYASAGFHYARPVSRYATMNLGYGVRWNDGRSQTGEPEIMHNVIAGVDYGRALSFSRRTSFTFGTGSAITVSEPVVDSDDSGLRTRGYLIGNVALVHELGRTWTAGVAYSRGLRARDGFQNLYLTDAVTASLGGLVSRRLQFSAGASWANSTYQDGSSNGNRGVSASARATYGLTSFAGLYAQYIYYRYRYDEEIPVDPRYPRRLDRHGVRVGLTTSIPLIR